MSFEYNGVVYRDLEPQVRYDAEQVQILKQADVTINENLQTVNENLQTINTEISGKLTKPTNPSAESAVTMLADGTVGTKPLSEIGGGGGKLYRHNIKVKKGNEFSATIVAYSSIGISLTGSQMVSIIGSDNKAPVFVETYDTSSCYGVCYGYFLAELVIQLYGVFCKTGNTPELRYGSPIMLDSATDTVTEL